MEKVICKECSKFFEVFKSKKDTKFCSRNCYFTNKDVRIAMTKKLKENWQKGEYKTMMINSHKGIIPTNLKQLAEMAMGEGNHNWKGNNVGYRGLHYWVSRKLGKANKCQFCDKEKTTPRSIHWANKSHTYLRELTDWISLCAFCHKQYDGAYKRSLTYSN